MKLYGISGLGADERVFKFLSIDYEIIPIKWIEPENNESIENYSLRLADQIISEENFGLIGVSFGGLIATELCKILRPEFTILISSVETKYELRKTYRIIGMLGILKFIPIRFFSVPKQIAKHLFGATNSTLLNQIIDDTNLKFAKWAIGNLTTWENTTRIVNCIKISGEKDKLMPPTKDKKTIIVKEGQHFMIVDRADEISKIVNKIINGKLFDYAL